VHDFHDVGEVPQFAPNFTVYLVQSDVVCLYSEHRKFFLYGALYCALASEIVAGTPLKSLAGKLERNFPPEKIQEALKRLFDQRFIVMRKGADGKADAYWASLGLLPEAAQKNLEKIAVRIEALDVGGARELGAALAELGVRVVRRSGDLKVVLVNDYLEERLDKINQRQLSDQKPWLLVQPSGIFPLVGPIFSPGKGACWTCLADRMKRNREIKAFLDRQRADCISPSPLLRDVFGKSAIQLAALEIAKAIATEFRTDLRDHVISLDLLGSAIVRHYVAARPQCPSCGEPRLRDPRRAPVPVEISRGGKLLMTSGGYRSVAPSATVARFRKHVSPLTGVVSRLERIEADLPMNTNYFATHNFSPQPQTVDELRAGLSGGSFGKGSSAEQGEASALMEAIERYSGIFQGDEIRVARRFADFSAEEAILPNDVLLFSDAQLRADHSQAGDQCDHHTPLVHLDPTTQIEWSPAWSLRDGHFKYLPTSISYFSYPDRNQHPADSNGCAAGNTLGEGIVQGFLELVERDSYAIWWYTRSQRTEVDLDQFDDPYIRDLRVQLAETGRRLWVLDITSDLGIPSYVALTHWVVDSQDRIEFGSGAHFDPQIALLRAMTELSQFLSIGLMGGRSPEGLDYHGSDSPPAFRLKDHPYLTPAGGSTKLSYASSKFNELDKRDQVMACVDLARKHGLDFLVLDQTRPDIEVPVVRVIVPGLRHFYPRFAPGRLYDVPVMLGLRDGPLSEEQLNPFHPRT
jgi:bacteriocin biosynthesis cyclodehydratase domain-containing protein